MEVTGRALHRVILVAGAVVGASACSVGNGYGAVGGSVFIRQCAKRAEVGASAVATEYSFGTAGTPVAYTMKPTFFAAESISDFARLVPNNRLNVRVQSDGSRIELADALFINMASVHEVAERLGQDIAVSYNTNVRATLSLNQSCPMPEVSPALEGVINFTQFGTANSGSVAPDFSIGFEDHLQAAFNFHIIDTRAATLGGVGDVPVDPAVGGTLSGYFDFIVRQGQRAQSYP